MLTRAAFLAAAMMVVAMPAAANCGAEGCPLSPRRLERSMSPWSIDVGYQYADQDILWSGDAKTTEPAPVGSITELYTRTSAYTLNGHGQVLPWLELSASLPYIEREHAHALQESPGQFVPSHWKYQGLGDAIVMATWHAYGSPVASAGEFALLGGVKLPTGVTDVGEVNGEAPEPPARPGTGSTDVMASLQYTRSPMVWAPGGRGTPLPLALSAVGRWNGKGTDDYRVGDEWHVSLSTAYEVVPRLSVLAQVNFLHHGRDGVGNTDAEPEHTGGESVFLTPGLRAALPGGATVYGYYQVRAYEHSNGPQLVANDHIIFGASFGLGR
jgi:outer membrane putative beta-barrel porin/alpha-amylase